MNEKAIDIVRRYSVATVGLIFVALGEGVALYGLLVSILIISKV